MSARAPVAGEGRAPQPRRWTLVYDGDCGFCTRSVRWLGRWDRRGHVRCVPLQDGVALATLPPLDPAALREAMHLLAPDGRVYRGAEAAPPLLRLLPGGPPLAWVFRLPGAARVADRAYRWIARRRHHLPGSSPTCAAPVEHGESQG